MDLRKISNANGEITDYQTSEDELKVWFAIGEIVLYKWDNDLEPYTQFFYDEGIISLPCYDSEVFWMRVTEVDTLIPDRH